MFYTAYGLSIRSEIELPELLPAVECEQSSATDVQISMGRVSESGLTDARRIYDWLYVSPNVLWLDINGVARFQITNGQHITIDPYPGSDEESIRVFLLGSAFGAILFQRGHFVLHGNAISIGDQCLVCVGDSGAGKSTLAAGFMQRGYSIMSDDVVPIDEMQRAIPGFPRIKLWQETADHLGIDTTDLRRIRPDEKKFNYPLAEQFQTEPLPVRWVYVLDTHDDDSIAMEPLSGMRRFQPLYENTYRPDYLEGMKLEAWQLRMCGQLAGKIHLVHIRRPRDGFDLEGLITEILADIEKTPGLS